LKLGYWKPTFPSNSFFCHLLFGVAALSRSLRMDAASAHRRDTAPAAAAVRSPLRARALQGNIPSIKSLLVLDSDGKRIISRYYKGEFASLAEVPPQPPARPRRGPSPDPRRRRAGAGDRVREEVERQDDPNQRKE